MDSESLAKLGFALSFFAFELKPNGLLGTGGFEIFYVGQIYHKNMLQKSYSMYNQYNGFFHDICQLIMVNM